jgi:hypothetical protein
VASGGQGFQHPTQTRSHRCPIAAKSGTASPVQPHAPGPLGRGGGGR